MIRKKEIRFDIEAALSRISTCDDPAKDDLKLVLAYMLTLLAYRSWQTTGAVTNATLQELSAAKEVRTPGSETVFVITVGRHKTASEGPAQITLSIEDQRLLKRYVRHVRPHCDPYGEADTLFVAVNGGPVTNMNRYLQWLGNQYKIKVPSCSDFRVAAATAAASELDPPERLLISSQMSHSQHVHAKYYEKLQGAKRAATAHMLRQQLISKPSSEESSEEECVRKTTPKKQKQPRTLYTAAEEDVIKSCFQTEIKNGTTASLSDCRTFLKRHPMERTDKQIQDKVKQLWDH